MVWHNRFHKEPPTTEHVDAEGGGAAAGELHRFGLPGWKDILLYVLLGVILLVAFDAGLWVRQAVWRGSEDTLHFMGDVRAGWSHGEAVIDRARGYAIAAGEETSPISVKSFLRAFRSSYDDVAEQEPDGDYRLDYPPLRLLVMSAWVRQIDKANPGVTEFDEEYVQPLLVFNTACALTAAIVAGIIVWQAMHKFDAPGSASHRPLWGGVLAGLLLWFNPAILLDAHVWPQWDAWPLPFLLLAILLQIRRWPMAAGASFIVATMLKGQVLLVAPVFVLWPIFAGRWRDALRLVIGAATATAIITAIWLIPSNRALLCIVAATIWFMLVLSLGQFLAKKFETPWPLPLGPSIAFIFSACVFFVGWWGGGSITWFEVGFAYGVRKFDNLHQRGTYNLPTILGNYGWKLHDLVSIPFFATGLQLELKTLLQLIYAALLLLSCIAIGRADQKSDRLFFITLTTPFILFYSILGQMHSRYLLFGAAVSSLCVTSGARGVVLSLATTILAAVPILQLELLANKQTNPPLLAFLHDNQSFFSYATLALAAVYLCSCLRVIVSAAHFHRSESRSDTTGAPP